MRPLLLALVLSLPLPAAAQPSPVPVATWLNDAAHAPAGDRLLSVMRSRGLHPVATCSAGCTLSVPTDEWSAAWSIAQELVTREHLAVDLIPMVTS